MLKSVTFSVILFFMLGISTVKAQCPVNIGFDMGDFTNWTGYLGTISNPAGILSLPTQALSPNVQSIYKRSAQAVDQYGHFPITSPNGSSFVAKLGDNTTGGGDNKAQQLTYTFKVPANDNEFSLIYYYAVVLEDPQGANHTDLNKPKFTAAVYDVSDNGYLSCGFFNFVSISKLPGFSAAPTQNNNNDVYYKDWSPVTIDLRGYAGKTLRLEFTTNNCGPGGHFAYAYIDVNQNCTSPVTGNVICPNSNSLNLTAPSGFQEYQWFYGRNFNTQISSGSTYSVSPIPPVGTTYSVIITPYTGLGCPDTITTTVEPQEKLALKVVDSVKLCKFQSMDITSPIITAGSDTSFLFNYYTDAACTNFITDPTNIIVAATYYIQANSPSGCVYVKPVNVSYLPTPGLKITNPPEVCAPATVDITANSVTAGSIMPNNPTYWQDVAATKPITNPKKITKSGTYYIKATNTNGCYDIEPVTVLIDELPILVTNDIQGCNTADITVAAATTGTINAATFSYFIDAAGKIPLTNPKTITTTSIYYIRAFSAVGCPSVVVPINVAVYPYPQSKITNPASVVFPQTVDITNTYTTQTGTVYYYYLDSTATKLIPDAAKIKKRGTYYIKAVNGYNCYVIYPVVVTILPPAEIKYGVNTFTPNGDGTNDVFRIVTPKSFNVQHFRIYGSWGGLVYDATDSNQGWDGNLNGKKMPVGTYYWIFEGFDTYTSTNVKKSGSVTIVR